MLGRKVSNSPIYTVVQRRLTVCQSIVPHVVARTVSINEEERCNVSRAIRCPSLRCRLRLLHGDGPGDVAQQQADGTHQVHDPPADLDHQQGHDCGTDHTPAGDGHVYFLYVGRVRHANHFEQVAEVVADEGVAGPLGEQAQHAGDEQAAAHPRGREEVPPGFLGGFDFERDRCVDLGHLRLDELRFRVAFCVVLDQDRLRLFDSILGYEPARRFGKEPVGTCGQFLLLLRSALDYDGSTYITNAI